MTRRPGSRWAAKASALGSLVAYARRIFAPAEDLKHRRRVALKVISPELASALGTDRFLREIQFAARLTHPQILPLHDIGWSTPRHGRSSMTCARTRGSSRCSAEWAFPDPSLPKFESLK